MQISRTVLDNFFFNISAVSLRRVERPNIDTRIDSHYLLGTQLTFDKIELLDALFDENGTVGSMEIVGDSVPGNGIVCVCICIDWMEFCIYCYKRVKD